jgi:hypothetical protein
VALKQKYLYKAKIKERAFLDSLSNLDHDPDDTSSSLSDGELDKQVEDKINRLCFFADTVGGLYTMALHEDAVGNDDKDNNDNTSKVSFSIDDLTAEVDELMNDLAT